VTSSEAPSTALTGAAAAEDMIAAFTVHDVRFPTSRQRDGSDAMNPFPDYSAAYLEVRTTRGDEGYALVFTPGRGNDLQAAAIRTLEPFVRDVPVDLALADLRSFSRRLTTDGQLRWLGPEKGPIHMAAGAIVNAMWDLAARRADLPLWRLLADLRPDQLVDLIDFTYLRDAMTEGEALQILRRAEPGREQRIAHLMSAGHPAYTTTPGWLGYTDERLVALSQEAVADGFRMIKLKVGGDLADDRRRLALVRQAVGPDIHIAIDANQVWGVPDAVAWVNALRPFDPYWIEEPTFPDDVLGHAAIRRSVAPVRVATGEHTANAVMFKQLLQAGAIDVVQIDACRVAGVNENIAIMLLAAKFGVPICPHAGGVGLCEMVQHLAMFDYVAISGSHEGRYVEYVEHLHEHFTNPVQVSAGAYAAPTAPGSGARMKAASVARYTYPDGAAWVGGR
jgi:L-fuconate dehydratase